MITPATSWFGTRTTTTCYVGVIIRCFFFFSSWYSQVYLGNFWIVYMQSKVIGEKNRLLCWSDYQVFFFPSWYSQVYLRDFWIVYMQSKVIGKKYRLLCWSDNQVFFFLSWYSQVYLADFWIFYMQSKVVGEKYRLIFLLIEESASLCLLLQQ